MDGRVARYVDAVTADGSRVLEENWRKRNLYTIAEIREIEGHFFQVHLIILDMNIV